MGVLDTALSSHKIVYGMYNGTPQILIPLKS
jgi:hypothetical protein